MRNSTPGDGLPHERRRCLLAIKVVIQAQHGHHARGLGESVHLHEVAFIGLDRTSQHCVGYWRGSVHDQLEARKIGLVDIRHPEGELQ